MKGESQPKLNSHTCLGDAEFDCKYPELVYLINKKKYTHSSEPVALNEITMKWMVPFWQQDVLSLPFGFSEPVL